MEVLLKEENGFLGLNSTNLIAIIGDRIRKSHSEENIKNILRRLPRTAFTSDVHYDYYNVYVKPKISLVGKTYVRRVRYYHNKKEQHYLYMNVMLGNNYIVLGFVRSISPIRDSDDSHYYHNDTRHTDNTYVLGLDTSGKLFVNKVGWATPIGGSSMIHNLSNITVYEVEDKDIINLLGFDRSTDALDEVVINEKGRYRVQGEIVMVLNGWRFENVNSLDDFKSYIESAFSMPVYDYIRYLAVDKLILVLNNIGYNVSPVRIDGVERIALVDAHRSRIDGREKAAALAKDLCYKLGCIDLTIDEYTLRPKATIYDPDIGNITMTIGVNGIPFGDRYGDIIISLDTDRSGRYRNMLFEDLRKQLDRLRPRNYRFAIGNHIIEIENAVSANLSYLPNIQPLILPLTAIRTNLDAYYVDEKSTLRISHPEHGINIVRFARPFAAEFGTTNISSDYPGEVNRMLLNKARKSHRSS